MPVDYAERLTDEQLTAVVEFLLTPDNAAEADTGFTLPPAIGQNDLPLGTSSGGTGAQPQPSYDSMLLVILLITVVVLLVFLVLIMRRRGR